MTNRDEIERLLNKTGRSLEGLPDIYPEEQRQAIWGEIENADEEPENRVLHQSDVIELLVGALRDALEGRDKEMENYSISRSRIADILRGKSIDTEPDVKHVAGEIHKYLIQEVSE